MQLKRLSFYFSALIIILIAVCISLFQLLTPLLNEHRSDFETWASVWLHIPVKIEKISIGWHHYYPLINLHDVSVYHPDTKLPLLKVNKISAYLSIVSSLWQQRIVLNSFLIKGTTINVYQNAQGDFVIHGFPELTANKASDTPIDDLLNIFANQPKLMLQDIEVDYTDHQQKKYNVTVHALQIANNDNEHIFTASAVLQQAISTDFNVRATWEGKVFKLHQMNGRVYVSANKFSLAQWLQRYHYQDLRVGKGMISFMTVFNIKNGSITNINTHFQLNDGLLLRGKETLAVQRLSGQVGIQKQANTLTIVASDLSIDTPGYEWPVTSVYAIVTKNASGVWLPNQVDIAYLNLKESMPWLAFMPTDLIAPFDETINTLKPSGELRNVKLTFAESNALTIRNASLQFTNLSFNALGNYPGVSALSGKIDFTPEDGHLVLSGKGGFHFSRTFSRAALFDKIDVDLRWQKEVKDNTWDVTINQLAFTNDVLDTSLKGSLSLPDKSSPLIDITGNFSVFKTEFISNYLPDKIFEPGLNKWLTQAFLKGTIDNGQVKLQGKLNEFPFDQGGTFFMTGHVQDVKLRYAPDWPVIDGIDGHVTFSGRKVLIDVASGRLEDIHVDLAKVSAVIPYLGDAKPAILEVVSLPMAIDLSQGTSFLMHTPLKNTYANILQSLHPSGPATLQLQLTVPLHNPDLTAVQAAVSIKESKLDMQDWGLQIDELHGDLTFTEKDITAPNLVGELFKQPITIQLKTQRNNKQRSTVDASFATYLNMSDLETWLKLSLSDYVTGGTNLSGVVHLSFAEPVSVELASNLQGVSLNIPKPYRKSVADERQFQGTLFASDKNGLRFRFDYDNLLSGAILLGERNKKFSIDALTLLLGGGQVGWPTQNGLTITGYLDRINWDEVQGYLTGDKKNATTHLPISLPLRRIDVTTGALSILNQEIKKLHIQVGFFPGFWDLYLDSPTVIGHIKVPKQFSRDEVISAQLDRLQLNASTQKGQSATFDLGKIPSIVFYANQVNYNQVDLGRMSFKTATTNRGVAIRNFTMNSSKFKLTGAGWWLKNGARYTTQLAGTAESANVSSLLQSFGFDVRNYVLKNGQLKYDLSWRQAPYSPEFNSMSGSAFLKIGKGQILEVSETSGAKMDIGRMLSIFSLQTIPRRFSLDFSDLFQSGYSFDMFQGDFSIKNGNINTSNTHFNGPVARIGIVGSIGLINKNYDLTLSVTPHVTSSIPIAATLLTANPVVGVAALAANKVLGSAISQATTYYYRVYGPWDHPTWQAISSGK